MFSYVACVGATHVTHLHVSLMVATGTTSIIGTATGADAAATTSAAAPPAAAPLARP